MFSQSTVPPDGDGFIPSEQDLSLVHFVSYNEAGEVLDKYHEAVYFYRKRSFAGELLVLGTGNGLGHYIEFVGEQRAPILSPRPQLEQSFNKTEIAVREAATLANVPAATVSFEGPVKGRHEHPGGDLVVGWTVPGTYLVKIEAFPFLPAEFTLTVGAAS